MSNVGSDAVNEDEVESAEPRALARLSAIVARTYALQRDPRRFGENKEHAHQVDEIGVIFDHGIGFLRRGSAAGQQAELRIEAPALYFVPAGHLHTTRWEKQSEVFCCHLKPAFWRRRMFAGRRPTLGPGVVPTASHDLVFWEAASVLRHVWDGRREPDDEMATLLADCMLLRAAKIILGDVLEGGSDAAESLGLSGARRATLDQFIDRQMSNHLHAPDLARAVGLSLPHFSALLKVSSGKTVLEYITQHRMRRAHQYLASGNYTLAEVAHAVGYQDVDYFSEKFKEYFNYPASTLMRRGRRLVPKNPEKP